MADNQFSVDVPSPLQALMIGEKSYNDSKLAAQQDRQKAVMAQLFGVNGGVGGTGGTPDYTRAASALAARAKEQLGLSAVLTRPDGFVAWASDGEPKEQSIRQAAGQGPRRVTGTADPRIRLQQRLLACDEQGTHKCTYHPLPLPSS